jgi:hypothetical protein
MMREKVFVMAVVDPEGVTHSYILEAKSLRHAKRQAREWVRRAEWPTLVSVGRADQQGSARRLLAIAGVTFVVGGLTISAAMIVGLSLEGAL